MAADRKKRETDPDSETSDEDATDQEDQGSDQDEMKGKQEPTVGRRSNEKTSLSRRLPPMRALPDMFSDMTSKALQQGLAEALQIFGGRPIKVATMCSGTEAPIFAFKLIAAALKSLNHEHKLNIEHMFSAEIVAWKQAFIERNFAPPMLFRDITKMKVGQKTETAYGAPVVPPQPGEVQILIAGFACVDHSNLNTVKRPLEADENKDARKPGESRATFDAIKRYASEHRPAIIILENILSTNWTKIIQELSEIEYSSEKVQLDSKNYYLPQTRMRGYLICIDHNPESSQIIGSGLERKAEAAQEKAKACVELVKNLSRQASTPVEDFLLQPHNPHLHQTLDQLDAKARKSGKQISDWNICKERHRFYRELNRLGKETPLTQWQTRQLTVPISVRKHWAHSQKDRVLDTLDIIYLENARRERDIEYKAQIVDLSQNVDRELDKTRPGLTGCITPSGLPFSTLRGRPLLGIEALSLQGIPIDTIQLTTESQSELQDLAGNAMTTTAIGAVILAALSAAPDAIKLGQLCHEQAIPEMEDPSPQLPEDGDPHGSLVVPMTQVCKFASLQAMSFAELTKLAGETLQYCQCEGQQKITSAEILQCRDCFFTVCEKCDGHPYHNLTVANIPTSRKNPKEFVNELFLALPTRLVLDLDFESFAEAFDAVENREELREPRDGEILEALKNGLGQEVRLRATVRGSRWTINYTSSQLRLVLQVTQTSAQWLLFVEAPRFEPAGSPLQHFLKSPIARLRLGPESDDLISGNWELCIPHLETKTITVTGKGHLAPSWRNELGLVDFTDEVVWTEIQIEEPRAHTKDSRFAIGGTYKLLPNCGTANRMLHCRTPASSDESSKPLFYFLDADLYDDARDVMVISDESQRLDPGDFRNVYGHFVHAISPNGGTATHPDSNRQQKPLEHGNIKSGIQKAQYCVSGKWVSSGAKLVVPPLHETEKISLHLDDTKSIGDHQNPSTKGAKKFLDCSIKWTDKNPDGSTQPGSWLITDANENHKLVDLKWLIKRIPILGGEKASPWTPLMILPWQKVCIACAPQLPDTRWQLQLVTKGKGKQKVIPTMKPYEDASQAGPFERAFKARPCPLVIQISIDDRADGANGSVKVFTNVEALLHRALAYLPDRTASDHLRGHWRVRFEYDPHCVPVRPKFRLSSNVKDQPFHFAFPGAFAKNGSQLSLRREQARSLRWMLLRESRQVPLCEEIVFEEFSSSTLNWRLEATVCRQRRIRGGIVADQVGYGKTILTLALIRETMHSASVEATEASSQTSFPLPIKATCVVVPLTLMAQWRREIETFWPGCRLIVIDKPETLEKYDLQDFKEAEIVLTSAKLLLEDTYIGRLSQLAAIPKPPKLTGTRVWKARELQAWLKTATQRLGENIFQLGQNGPTHWQEYLRYQLANYKGDWVAYNTVTSKRYKGAAFQKHQEQEAAKEEGAEADQACGQESDEEDMEDADGNSDEDTAEHMGPNKDPSAAQNPAGTAAPNPSELFNTLTLGEPVTDGLEGDGTRRINGPVLNLFRFYRKVIDEQTYVSAPEMKAISAITSCTNWILSATPYLSDFADIQRLAEFLGFYLGVDDASGTTQRRNVAAMQKERTAVEEFQALQISRSAEWHSFRDQLAQNFLSRFARSNQVEHANIPMTEHYVPIRLDAVHSIVHAETQAMLLNGELEVLRTTWTYGSPNDRIWRLENLLGMRLDRSSEPKRPRRGGRKPSRFSLHEALVSIASCDMWRLAVHNSAASLISGITSSRDGMEKVVRNALLEHFRKTQQGWEAFRVSVTEKSKWEAIKLVAEQAGFGDTQTTELVLQLHDGSESMEEATWDQVCAWIRELLPKGSFPPNGKTIRDYCRKRCAEAQAVARDYTECIRAMRVFEKGQHLQDVSEGIVSLSKATVDCICQFNHIDDLVLSAWCGHIVCRKCFHSRMDCPVQGCDAGTAPTGAITTAQLGNRQASYPRYGSSKIDKMVTIIESLGEDEQVLVFSQFDSVTLRICEGLRSAGIDHRSVKEAQNITTAKRADAALTAFRSKTRDKEGKWVKVLILNPADASAAGHNLTNASTVIFVSPLITFDGEDGNADFAAKYTQAIGRVRRFGQTKTVHVYHLLTLDSTDIDIFEKRTKTKLGFAGPEEEELTAISQKQYETDSPHWFSTELGSPFYRSSELAQDGDEL